MILIYAIAANWLGLFALCWIYVGWLWIVSCDIKLEGWVWWRGFFPVARFRLISRKSWFARAWEDWYGHGLFGSMIHKDEKGSFDDEHVEKTIVHELNHHAWQAMLGMVFYLVYKWSYVIQEARGKDGYHDNWLEVKARAAADRWVDAGRPRVFNFGVRR